MKRFALVAAVLLGVPAAMAQTLAAQTLAAQTLAAPTFGSRSHFTEQGGAEIYTSVCAACHMSNGLGASGAGSYPALAHDPRLGAAAYPIAVVVMGQKAMPSFAETLSDQQIADTVNYVRTNFGNAYPDHVTAAEVCRRPPIALSGLCSCGIASGG